MTFTVSAPAERGLRREFKTFVEARDCAASLLNVPAGSLTLQDGMDQDGADCCYCYKSDEAAMADMDGAYAVRIIGGHASAYLPRVRARYYPPDGDSCTQVPEDFLSIAHEWWFTPAEAIAAIRGAAPVPPGIAAEAFCDLWYDENLGVHVHESDAEGCGGFALVWTGTETGDEPLRQRDLLSARSGRIAAEVTVRK